MPKISSSPNSQTPFEKYFTSIKELGLGFSAEDFLCLDFERNWELTSNPLFVWGGLMVCEAHGLEIPHWILDYIYQRAKKLSFHDFTNEKRASQTVYDLLGLNYEGSGTFFSQFQDYFVHDHAQFMVEEYLKKFPTASKSQAFEHVGGKLHMAPETIKKWHKIIDDRYNNPTMNTPKKLKED